MRALLTKDIDILQLSQLRNYLYTFHLVRLGTTHNEKCGLLSLLPRFEVDEDDFVAAPPQSMCPISIRRSSMMLVVAKTLQAGRSNMLRKGYYRSSGGFSQSQISMAKFSYRQRR